MLDQIEKFYRQGYVDFIRINAMQMDSQLSDTVDMEPQRGVTMNLDKYEKTVLRPRMTRNEENMPTQVPRERRGVSPLFWEHAELFDPRDEVRLMRSIRPDSQYARTVLSAFNRKKDELIVDAYTGDVVDGEGTTLTFATDGGITINAASTEILTVSKVIEARRQLEVNDAQSDVRWYGAMHPISMYGLLEDSSSDERIASWDFNALRPLMSGEVTIFMGFEWRTTTEILHEATLAGGGEAGRKTFWYTSDSVVWAPDGDVDIHFDIIPEIGHSLQVAHYSTMNAVRMHGEKIVVVESQEDA